MTERVLLVLDRSGGRWGAASAEVRPLARRAGRYLVATGAGTIWADPVLEVAARVPGRPAGPVLRRHRPVERLGIGVRQGVPVVVVRPGALPRAPLDRRRENPHVTKE